MNQARITPFCLLLALFATVARGADPAADDKSTQTVDLLIVAGQSNAVGYDAKPGELPPSDADREIRFWWRCGDPPPD